MVVPNTLTLVEGDVVAVPVAPKGLASPVAQRAAAQRLLHVADGRILD